MPVDTDPDEPQPTEYWRFRCLECGEPTTMTRPTVEALRDYVPDEKDPIITTDHDDDTIRYLVCKPCRYRMEDEAEKAVPSPSWKRSALPSGRTRTATPPSSVCPGALEAAEGRAEAMRGGTGDCRGIDLARHATRRGIGGAKNVRECRRAGALEAAGDRGG